MNMHELLANTPASTFRVREKRPGIYQLVAPIFHDDGDMMSIYLEHVDDSAVRICDHGMSLMRLSYLFDVDSDHKKKVLNSIISNRGANLENGGLELVVPSEDLFSGIMNFTQLVSEVCNMDILTREMISSMFYEYLGEAIDHISVELNTPVIKDYQLKDHPDINVDYAILGTNGVRPIYLFGVKDTNRAQQAAISCLNLTLRKTPHRSISVFENIDNVSTFARNALLNASGKVYSDLDGFKQSGAGYIAGELAG